MPRSLSIPGTVGYVPGVGIKFNRSAIAVMLYGAQGEVGKDIQRRAYAVQKRMKRLAPVKTGQLRSSIHVVSVRESSKGPVSKIYVDAPHAIVAELGRRSVRAGGDFKNPANRPKRDRLARRVSGKLVWSRDAEKVSKFLYFNNKRGQLIRIRVVGPAKGARYIENSIDVALD